MDTWKETAYTGGRSNRGSRATDGETPVTSFAKSLEIISRRPSGSQFFVFRFFFFNVLLHTRHAISTECSGHTDIDTGSFLSISAGNLRLFARSRQSAKTNQFHLELTVTIRSQKSLEKFFVFTITIMIHQQVASNNIHLRRKPEDR